MNIQGQVPCRGHAAGFAFKAVRRIPGVRLEYLWCPWRFGCVCASDQRIVRPKGRPLGSGPVTARRGSGLSGLVIMRAARGSGSCKRPVLDLGVDAAFPNATGAELAIPPLLELHAGTSQNPNRNADRHLVQNSTCTGLHRAD